MCRVTGGEPALMLHLMKLIIWIFSASNGFCRYCYDSVLRHDDANRALMGANMQRQAVPLLTVQARLDWVQVWRRRQLLTPVLIW